MTVDPYQRAAQRLHSYLLQTHWDGRGLTGPDPGPRFSYRIGRFIKSYTPFLGWNEQLYYLQGQGYWTIGNMRLFALTGDTAFRDTAAESARRILAQQRDDGAWEYPHPEWKGRIAAFEGMWATLGLLEAYRHTGESAFLTGALRWYRYQTEEIGFQQMGDELSANYFAGRNVERTLNTSTSLLRVSAELYAATGDARLLERAGGLLAFVGGQQCPSGELPYTVAGPRGGRIMPHFQCYQYQGFHLLDMLRYEELTGDGRARPISAGLTQFLQGGVGADGHLFYDCHSHRRAVVYHAAVAGAALAAAYDAGLGQTDLATLATRAYGYVLRAQRADGSFGYSRNDYGVLRDERSYPRYLAMILCHLLEPAMRRMAALGVEPVSSGGAPCAA
jgi:hypothetical protein